VVLKAFVCYMQTDSNVNADQFSTDLAARIAPDPTQQTAPHEPTSFNMVAGGSSTIPGGSIDALRRSGRIARSRKPNYAEDDDDSSAEDDDMELLSIPDAEDSSTESITGRGKARRIPLKSKVADEDESAQSSSKVKVNDARAMAGNGGRQ
jgi:hypothetical protein